jgi:MFS family permease
MAASTTLPLLFLALAAGAVADLANRGKVLLISQSLMGLAAAGMAAITALDLVTPGRLLGLSLLLGVGVAFNLPAWQAMVPDLVPRGMVASAVALNSVAFNVARAVGPALGGVIVATAGPELAFTINAFSYLGVIAVLAVLAPRFAAADREATSVANAIANGVRFARFTRPFRMLLLLAALFALTSAVVQTVLPNRTEELGGSADAFGLLLGAIGLGALVGAFTRHQVVETLGVRSIPITITVFGAAGVAAGLSPTIWWTIPGLLIAGMAWVWTLTTTNATAQLMSPEWVRGRAMSLYSLAFVGILPLGSILAGAVADLIGAGAAIVALSIGSIVLGVAAPRFGIPALADVVTPEFSEEHEPSGHVETEGGPVMIVNTWMIDGRTLDEFLTVMTEVRLVRLRTGAYRWRLYRNASDPHRLSEIFLTVSWDEHLAQHGRIDDASADLLRHARSFDTGDGPMTRHLVAVDVDDPDDWEPLLAAHEEFHRKDGSIPLSTA